jgi:arylsulfatase A-like enzyme
MRFNLPVCIVVSCLTLISPFLEESVSLQAAEPNQPNILFVFSDDQCYDTIGALGNDEVHTPNLDRLVRRGTTFTHAYNMGGWSGAICVASRTMLATGRFLWHAHQVDRELEKERQAGRLWSEYLKQAGYRTYFTGKWHLRADASKAFDVARHIRGGMPAQTPAGYNRPIDGQPDPWSPFDPQFGGFWEGGTHWSEVLADDAVSYLQTAAQDDRPFFMYLAFNAPHDPRQSPEEYVRRYPSGEVKLPASFLPEYPFKDAIGCGVNLRDEKLAPFPRTEHAVRVNRQEYYAIITHMDAQIGRILDALEASGKAGETWIFFTSDHGLAVGHHGLLGKQNMYDHSVRVPFVIVGPGVEAGKKIEAPIYLQDVMPTALELAGVERPDHVQFQSLLPLLNGESQGAYDAVYGAYLDKQRMITQGGYKLILYPEIAKLRLYHLESDPKELRDLADDSRNRTTIQRLFARLLELQQETGDGLALKAIYGDLVE